MSDVSVGTGVAGPFGNLWLLGFRAAGLSNAAIFLIALPTVLIYQVAIYWLARQKKKFHFINAIASDQQETDKENNLKLNWTNFKLIWPRTWDLMLNICFVYGLEYSCIGCFADRLSEYNKEVALDKDSFLV